MFCAARIPARCASPEGTCLTSAGGAERGGAHQALLKHIYAFGSGDISQGHSHSFCIGYL